MASITLEGMGPYLAVEGSATKEVFEAYLVEQVLLPEVQEGQVLIMEKLPAHKPNRMRELIEQRGCELSYLPSYSPDYNPIEETFSIGSYLFLLSQIWVPSCLLSIAAGYFRWRVTSLP